MGDWLTPAEIVALGCPALPSSVRGLNRLAERSGWRQCESKARLRKTAGRPVWQYHISLLPAEAQQRGNVVTLHQQAPVRPAEITAAWERFERLSSAQKLVCEARLKALHAVDAAIQGGASVTAAVTHAAGLYDASERAIYGWRRAVESADRKDWLALLAPKPRAARERVERRVAASASGRYRRSTSHLLPHPCALAG